MQGQEERGSDHAGKRRHGTEALVSVAEESALVFYTFKHVRPDFLKHHNIYIQRLVP